jgi:hypothetical protein
MHFEKYRRKSGAMHGLLHVVPTEAVKNAIVYFSFGISG